MKYRADYRSMSRWLKSPEARRPTTLAAADAMSRMRGTMRADTGATAASGRLIQGIGGRKKDRVMVTIEFGLTAVIQQFGNKRQKATRPMTRALVEEGPQ